MGVNPRDMYRKKCATWGMHRPYSDDKVLSQYLRGYWLLSRQRGRKEPEEDGQQPGREPYLSVRVNEVVIFVEGVAEVSKQSRFWTIVAFIVVAVVGTIGVGMEVNNSAAAQTTGDDVGYRDYSFEGSGAPTAEQALVQRRLLVGEPLRPFLGNPLLSSNARGTLVT
jgi:hypothetical protein